ncbi:hypothetical protein MTBLM1_20150 [Rhodospirillaceae bacterium LM-1]|nr:hypothetical protein MTBLM1_20150 [Rhodospirillaceae bacterium LM-1]
MEAEVASAITESELYVPLLQILDKAPGGFMTTAAIVVELENLFQPEGIDAEILKNRSDTHFSQKVRNIISHKNVPGNPINDGLVIYHSKRHGLEITDAGRAYLKRKGL